jgi:site-specific DNA recombinase
VRTAIYARVSTEGQQQRGTIGSQLQVLRQRVAAEGDELVAEFCDDGHSGSRLDRPGLDALRDAAEAGLIDTMWCLSPDRLARIYAYQVIVLDEMARHGVTVRFTDAPPIDDDPQARLLTQVQGVIAEYERAKIAERYRRGKLFRSRPDTVRAERSRCDLSWPRLPVRLTIVREVVVRPRRSERPCCIRRSSRSTTAGLPAEIDVKL